MDYIKFYRFITIILIFLIASIQVISANQEQSNLFPMYEPVVPIHQGIDNATFNLQQQMLVNLHPDKTTSTQLYVPGEILVKYAPQSYPNETDNNRMALESTIIGASTILDYTPEGISGLYLLSIPIDIPIEEAVIRYEEQPGVLFAEPNYYIHAAVLPNDPDFNFQWGLHNTGQIINGIAGYTGSDIHAPEAWDINTGNRDQVIVALLDSGVDLNHPDLALNLWTDPMTGTHGYDVIDGDYIPMDLNGHGTHCAGIIGAVGNNGIGVTGVNWQTQIMAVRFLNAGGEGTVSGVISAIRWALEHNADVISCSFVTTQYSQTLYEAISSSPVLFVCAAGNNHENIDVIPFYPASFNSPNIISTGSVDNQDNLALTSNYGIISVDLVAPGVDIFSTTPYESETNGENYNDISDYEKDYNQAYTSGYGMMSGTSMAVPFVSGSAAILMDTCPTCSYEQIYHSICDTTDPIPALFGYIRTGGRLNLSKAIQSLSPVDPDTGDLPLAAGWNLISIPKVLQSGYDTAVIFSAISTSGHSILLFEDDTWRSMKSDEKILPLQGIWMFSENQDTVHLLFDPNPLSLPERQIRSGWESVGYYGLLKKYPCDAFSSLSDSWKFIIGFDGTTQRYSDTIQNACPLTDPEEVVMPYHGYWLFSQYPGILKAE